MTEPRLPLLLLLLLLFSRETPVEFGTVDDGSVAEGPAATEGVTARAATATAGGGPSSSEGPGGENDSMGIEQDSTGWSRRAAAAECICREKGSAGDVGEATGSTGERMSVGCEIGLGGDSGL